MAFFFKQSFPVLALCLAQVFCSYDAMAQSLGLNPSASSGVGLSPLQVQADLLFKRILLRPTDLEAAFQLADIETQLGDYEAAIGSLERMLFYATDLPRVKLELGILYFRLGSYAMARSYFEEAVSGKDVPPEVAERVRGFQAEIDRRLSQHQFTFFAQTGLRYQSNANAGPNSATVRALGETATLSSKFTRRSDGNAFVLGSLQYVYDFENQRGDVWETNAIGYYAGQFSLSRLNLGLGEVDTGPRLAVMPGLSIRPYALGGDVSLGDTQYLGQGGGGLNLRYVFGNGTQVDIGAEGRARAFSNSSPYLTAHDQRGDQAIVPLVVSGPAMFDGLRWQGRLSYVHSTAFARYFGYDQFGVELALPYQFTGFFGSRERPWVIAPFASYFNVAYAGADPIVDPGMRRHDHLVQGGATLDMPITKGFGLAITAQYVETLSNIPNFRTTDFIVSGGPTFRY